MRRNQASFGNIRLLLSLKFNPTFRNNKHSTPHLCLNTGDILQGLRLCRAISSAQEAHDCHRVNRGTWSPVIHQQRGCLCHKSSDELNAVVTAGSALDRPTLGSQTILPGQNRRVDVRLMTAFFHLTHTTRLELYEKELHPLRYNS